MATFDTNNLDTIAHGLRGMPRSRQVLFWVLLTASIALAAGVILWAFSPRYSHLGYSIGSADAGRIMQVLQRAAIRYRVDERNGAIQVVEDRLVAAHEALNEAGVAGERAGRTPITVVPYYGVNPLVPGQPPLAAGPASAQTDQLGQAQRIEANYKQRIEDILTPIIGRDGVRAQVSMDMAAPAPGSKETPPAARPGKLSIAVVVDNRLVHDGEVTTRRPLSEAELERITALVKDAVGFDDQRGDTLNILNAAFSSASSPNARLNADQQQDRLWDIGRKLTGVLLALLIIFGILRPVLRELLNKGRDISQVLPPEVLEHLEATGFSLNDPDRSAHMRRRSMQEQINTARSMAIQDPRRVAQVLRSWMGSR